MHVTGSGLAPVVAIAILLVVLPMLLVGEARATGGAVYVAASGSDANPCTETAPCATFDRGYHAAQSGDNVFLAGGTYPAQSLTADPTKTSTDHVVIEPVAGATVVVGGCLTLGTWNDNGPKHLTLKDIHSAPYDGSTCTSFAAGEGTQDVTWVNLDASDFYLRGVKDFHIVGGDWGPCYVPTTVPDACGNNKIDWAAAPYENDNITIDGARFHNMQCGGYPGRAAHDCSGTGIHFECLYVAGGTNIQIRNSRFTDCEFYDIFFTNIPARIGAFDGLLVENNSFDTPWDGQQHHSRDTSIAFKPNGAPSPAFANVLVRYNSFGSSISVNDDGDGNVYSDFRIVGNIFGYSGCYPSASFDRNVQVGGACSSDVDVTSFPYLNKAAGDFALTGGPAVDLLPGSSADEQLATDIDGQARPAGLGYDAGADEFGSGLLSPPPLVPTITDGPLPRTSDSSATFAFTVGDPNASFECALDDSGFSPCSSPTTYLGLKHGSHTFQVQAEDPAGNVGPAALYAWKIAPPWPWGPEWPS